MNPKRAQELLRSFVRSRQDAHLGWPDKQAYNEEDMAYFDILEEERIAGRVKIEGEILSWDEFLRKTYNETRNSPGWESVYESFSKEDQEKLVGFDLDKNKGEN